MRRQVLCLLQLRLSCSRLKIVDDDIDWKQTVKEEVEVEEDEEDAPVVRLHRKVMSSL